MVGPFTPNAGFIVPNTGDLPDTWGEDALNPDYVAIDGMFCGVQTINLTVSNVTLTSEAGFSPTPGAGPTQSQNRVLRFTGAPVGGLIVTLPIPCSYICENLCTGGAVLELRGATATEVVCLPQGERVEVYNDGSRVKFVGLARMGAIEHWAGLSSIPNWVTGCTVRPYLLCDGSVYNVADYPHLGARLGSAFGGNGVTTFGVPDLRGRVPLAYDGTGTRITTAGSGIDGQTVGEAGGSQNVTLVANQIPSLTSSATVSISVSYTVPGSRNLITGGAGVGNWTPAVGNGGSINTPNAGSGGASSISSIASSGDNNITVNYTNGGQQVTRTVPPAQVTGIWVIKT